jgi:hypothetical protein
MCTRHLAPMSQRPLGQFYLWRATKTAMTLRRVRGGGGGDQPGAQRRAAELRIPSCRACGWTGPGAHNSSDVAAGSRSRRCDVRG